MAPTRRQKSTKDVGPSSQAPPQPRRVSWTTRARGNILHPLDWTHPNDFARCHCLNERTVVAIRYYDEELLARLGMLDDIRWLIARGAMGHLLEIKEHTYRDLALEFLNTLHAKVTRGPQCQVGYISFYLQGQLHELNLGTFNSIFGFPPSMDLLNRQVPREFNPNSFWGVLSGSVRYSTISSKCAHIRNPCIRIAQRILTCSLFARDDSLNVPRLSCISCHVCLMESSLTQVPF